MAARQSSGCSRAISKSSHASGFSAPSASQNRSAHGWPVSIARLGAEIQVIRRARHGKDAA